MSETATMTLAGFLLARIAEDEEIARDAGPHEAGWMVVEDHGGDYSKPLEYRVETKPYPHQFTRREEPFSEPVAVLAGAGALNLEGAWASRHITRHDPARVLAECEAKRRIVEYAQTFEPDRLGPLDPIASAQWVALDAALHLLALPYADHPDYREEWRP